MRTVNRLLAGCLLAMMGIAFAGCAKKQVAKSVPPVPAAKEAAPTVSLAATPPMIERGQQTTLKWSSDRATALTLEPGLGAVASSGTMSLSPYDSTTYRLVAHGPGGSADASARVTVTSTSARTTTPTPGASEDLAALFNRSVQDIHFDYDKAQIRGDAMPVLQKDADFLRDHPRVNIILEGHCDDRGSEEYNLGLGDRRATAARQYLISLGIDASRIRTISYGKEKPVCTNEDESCWSRNRRGHPAIASLN